MINSVYKFFTVDMIIKGGGLLALPIFAKYMGPEELGRFSEWFTAYNALCVLLSLGIPSYILVKKSQGAVSNRREKYIFSSSGRWVLFVVFLQCFFLEKLGLYFFITINLSALAFFIIDYSTSIIRYRDSVDDYIKLQLLNLLSGVIFPLLFLFYSSSSQTRVYVFVLSNILIASIFCFGRYIPKVSFAFISRSVRQVNKTQLETYYYGFPLILVGVVSWLKLGSDIQILKSVIDYEFIGELSLANQILAVVTISAASLNRSASKALYEHLRLGDFFNWFKMIIKFELVVILLSLFSVILVFLFQEFIVPDYGRLLFIYLPMVLGAVFYTFGQFLSSALLFYKRTTILSVCLILSALFHPVCSYFIVYNFSYDLVPFSYLFSSFLFCLLVSFSSIKYVFAGVKYGK